MFVAAGFGEAVERARVGDGQTELLELLPPGVANKLGLLGGLNDVRGRLSAYAAAGLDGSLLYPPRSGDH